MWLGQLGRYGCTSSNLRVPMVDLRAKVAARKDGAMVHKVCTALLCLAGWLPQDGWVWMLVTQSSELRCHALWQRHEV